MQLRLLGGGEPSDDLKKDLRTMFSLPLDRLGKFLEEIGKDQVSTHSSEAVAIAKDILQVDEETAKDVYSVALYLAPRLYPVRFSNEEIIEDLKRLEITEERIVAFLRLFNELQSSVKDEIRYGGLISQIRETVDHLQSFSVSTNLKPVFNGDIVIGMVPVMNLTLKIGSLFEKGDEQRINIEMYPDEADWLITRLKSRYESYMTGINNLKPIIGDIISLRARG